MRQGVALIFRYALTTLRTKHNQINQLEQIPPSHDCNMDNLGLSKVTVQFFRNTTAVLDPIQWVSPCS